MTVFAVILLVALVLTLGFGWSYIDSIRDERSTDAYELGWTNGYEVGSKFVDEKYNQGWEDGHRTAKAQANFGTIPAKPVKAPVKKKSAKKITSKEN